MKTTQANALQDVETIFRELADELADTIGRFDIDDEAAWALSKGVHRVFRNALRRTQTDPAYLSQGDEPPCSDHPAIRELRRLLNSGTDMSGYPR